MVKAALHGFILLIFVVSAINSQAVYVDQCGRKYCLKNDRDNRDCGQVQSWWCCKPTQTYKPSYSDYCPPKPKASKCCYNFQKSQTPDQCYKLDSSCGGNKFYGFSSSFLNKCLNSNEIDEECEVEEYEEKTAPSDGFCGNWLLNKWNSLVTEAQANPTAFEAAHKTRSHRTQHTPPVKKKKSSSKKKLKNHDEKRIESRNTIDKKHKKKLKENEKLKTDKLNIQICKSNVIIHPYKDESERCQKDDKWNWLVESSPEIDTNSDFCRTVTTTCCDALPRNSVKKKVQSHQCEKPKKNIKLKPPPKVIEPPCHMIEPECGSKGKARSRESTKKKKQKVCKKSEEKCYVDTPKQCIPSKKKKVGKKEFKKCAKKSVKKPKPVKPKPSEDQDCACSYLNKVCDAVSKLFAKDKEEICQQKIKKQKICREKPKVQKPCYYPMKESCCTNMGVQQTSFDTDQPQTFNRRSLLKERFGDVDLKPLVKLITMMPERKTAVEEFEDWLVHQITDNCEESDVESEVDD